MNSIEILMEKSASELRADERVLVNREIVSRLADAPDGKQEKFAALSTKLIRRELRENSFHPEIIPVDKISDEDLHYDPNSENLSVTVEVEPHSRGAKIISFNDGPDSTPFYGDKAEVYLHTVTTPEFYKNVNQLRTYKNDIRQIVVDNSLKDIHTTEDEYFIKRGVDRVVGPVSGVGLAGYNQNQEISGGITKENYLAVQDVFVDRRLPLNKVLLNLKTFNRFAGLGLEQVGDALTSATWRRGMKAYENGEILGIPHVVTIKSDLVPDGVTYQFTDPEHLGISVVLQDVTMYVEKRKSIIRFSAEKIFGMGLINVAGVNRIKFLDI